MKMHRSSALALLVLAAWPVAGMSAAPNVPGAYGAMILAQDTTGVRCVAGVVTNPAEGSPTGYPCPPGSVPSNSTAFNAPKPAAEPAGPVNNYPGGGAYGSAYTGTGGTAGTVTPDNTSTVSGSGATMGIGGTMDIGGVTGTTGSASTTTGSTGAGNATGSGSNSAGSTSGTGYR